MIDPFELFRSIRLLPVVQVVQNADRFTALVEAVVRRELLARLAVAMRARAEMVRRAEEIYWRSVQGAGGVGLSPGGAPGDDLLDVAGDQAAGAGDRPDADAGAV